MTYTEAECERAKTLFARATRQGTPKRMAVAAGAVSSRPGRIFQVTHKRAWRDHLPQARRDLQQESSG